MSPSGVDTATRQHASGLDDVLEALRQHDVVLQEEAGCCRYSVEWMRRWVQAGLAE